MPNHLLSRLCFIFPENRCLGIMLGTLLSDSLTLPFDCQTFRILFRILSSFYQNKHYEKNVNLVLFSAFWVGSN